LSNDKSYVVSGTNKVVVVVETFSLAGQWLLSSTLEDAGLKPINQ